MSGRVRNIVLSAAGWVLGSLIVRLVSAGETTDVAMLVITTGLTIIGLSCQPSEAAS